MSATTAPLVPSTTQNQVALNQTTLAATMKNTTAKNLKRKLAIADGSELDLTQSIPVTPQVVEAMRQRIIELEDQLMAFVKPPAKRARTSAAAAGSSDSAPVTSTSASATTNKADEKKRKAQVKKFADRLKKECKSAAVKFQGTSKTIKFDEVLEQSEFETIFGGKGNLIQPTPTNKPNSTVTIIHFDAEQAAEFFGNDLKGLKGFTWSRGGAPHFSKSEKLGPCDLSLLTLDVNYSKNGMKCTLKFEVEDPESSGICFGSSRRSFGWYLGGL
ncbi:hypothetical protein FA15DRAFT_584523 [Coprinopsis marcescibilis]|uniref:Uncharacterized protein n=1 Tax=Coprinopsis marcescibilis TaxID=230819 RepID=A0A5C3L5W7_COPMA|nr:hypothetical protein FA15DRAFT_584523 [Coprinopsis marcescibilis]